MGRGDGAFLRVLSGGHNGDTGGGLAVMEDTEVERRMGGSSYNATDFLVLQPAAKQQQFVVWSLAATDSDRALMPKLEDISAEF